jgi:hypothetical protein
MTPVNGDQLVTYYPGITPVTSEYLSVDKTERGKFARDRDVS